ncbi:GMC family oxidoreductase [Flavobacterium cellulosilyticum]|uniref:GMC family oxidoreductase n=1 Tax=Flavobacterium cellulosilyticum TaxID=2541731 RepID=A0A4R5CC14_9FLAO|nr:GMC oxidoreductase [Flavobacterium cellulosilyticum]TDD94684.1 GMC family oxidoreductase [Flavobacterium cellulosilyticum]
MVNSIYDLCVIGGGPAGIITAIEYAKLNTDKQVVLIEYGNTKEVHNTLDDTIIIKNKINHHDPYECTNKGLGGSTQTYGGRCVMYDAVDFQERSILLDGCTWDELIFKDSQKYIPLTSTYFECGEPLFDLQYSKDFKDKRIAENFVNAHITDTKLERWSMPTRFGKRYRKDLEDLSNITILEGYQAVSFSEPTDDGLINEVHLVNRDLKQSTISSIKFVIACGTQETTRLLLKNKTVFKKLNKVPDALGKYYQCHLSGKIASVIFSGDPKKTEYGFLRDKEGIYLRRRFQFTSAFLKQKNLLNTAIWLDNPLYSDPNHKSGSMSLMYLIMLIPFLGSKLAPPAIAESITKGERKDIDKHLWNILKDFPFSITTTFDIFVRRYLLKRKLPGVFLYNKTNKYALHFHAEQTPDSKNTMRLSDDQNNLIIDYNLNDSDINSVILLHDELDTYLRKINCGKLEYWYPKEELFEKIKLMSKDGLHQSGTTRIAKDKTNGVVDENLMVFGTTNLFVCSGSVFPTSSQANTTFFLGVLAIRLANFISIK